MSLIRPRQHALTALFPHNANRRFIIPKRRTLSQVPDVVDTAELTAEAAIVAAGYTLGTQTSANDAVIIIGNIISTDPAADTFLELGKPVDYVVSLGP